MLEVQSWLRQHNGDLTKLNAELGINAVLHPTDPLVLLNYDQIESKPKNHPIVMECRALCLELGSFDIVGLSFPRFFNLGELPDYHDAFCWDSFSTQEKIDGSLIILLNYDGKWRLHSRGSFGQGEVNGSGLTWETLFMPLVKNLDQILHHHTLVLEGVSLFNKIVISYSQPQLFLLTAFNRVTGMEASIETTDALAETIGVQRPKVYKFIEQENIVQYVNSQPGKDFEGVVLRDCNNMRLKIKSKEYLNLWHMVGNGNLWMPKYLVPVVLKGELDEIKVAFPELIPSIEKTQNILNAAYQEAHSAFLGASALDSQKAKAIYLQSRTRLVAPCFTALKTGKPFDEVWRESSEFLTKFLFKG